MNRCFVWLTGVLAPLWRRLGADPHALQLIFDAKLKIGERTTQFMGQQQKRDKNYTWVMYLFLGAFGLLVILGYYLLDDKATAIGLIFSFVFIYLGFMLVTEMSENMFDLRDLTILLSRPISDTTFSLSPALHIACFAAKGAMLLLTPLGIALVLLAGPLAALLYAVLAVMLVIMTILLTLGLYLTLLKRVAAARFQQLLAYFQIIISCVFFIAYQLPNFLNLSGYSPGQLSLVGTWWGFAGPGLWLGGIWDVILEGGSSTVLSLLQSGLGVTGTILSVVYYLRQSEGYGERLLELQIGGSQGAPEPETRPQRVRSDWIVNPIERYLTRPGVERAGFRFTWAIMARDMRFKQQVYPGVVIIPLLVIIYVFREWLMDEEAVRGMGFHLILIILYFFLALLITPLVTTRTSTEHQAGWVLRSNPLADRRPLLYGQLIAVAGQFYLPVGCIGYLCLLIGYGPELLDDIVLSIAVVLLGAAVFQLNDSTLAFSREKKQGGYSGLGSILLVYLLASFAGLAHWALTYLPYGVTAVAVVAWGICWLTFRELRSGVVK